jgi:NADH:ubiquinone oxidoreductase subunit
MKQFLLEVFTWWNSRTMGTRFFTWRKGIRVGEDEFGNVYYKERGGNRRWVIYNGLAEASMIPPGWHGWMHHRTNVSPAEDGYIARDWEQAHRPNLTGTAGAYRPNGSAAGGVGRPAVTGDYDAWTPGS